MKLDSSLAPGTPHPPLCAPSAPPDAPYTPAITCSNAGPIEQHISNNLRAEVSGLSDRPQQLLREFMRYRNLMARKNISKNLQGERETLLAQLTAYVEQLDNDFETYQSESKAPAGKNLPRVTNIVVWAKQLEAKLQGLMTHSQSLLGDLPSHTDFASAADELLSKTRAWRKEEFEKWCSDTEDALEDGQLSLEMTGTLMEISHEGTLMVNYSERLVQLLREVRQLDELGHSVPRKIRAAAADAEKYYRYGVMLKKVANFFNSMDSEIIETQKPMLLDGPWAGRERAPCASARTCACMSRKALAQCVDGGGARSSCVCGAVSAREVRFT